MAYTPEQKYKLFEIIFQKIEDGSSLRKALIEVKLPAVTFYEWIDNDEPKAKQYARACEARAETIVDEILDLADTMNADMYLDDNGNAQLDGAAIQRSKLQVDTRKWLVGKLNPKKYGDKVDVTSGGDKISSAPTAINIGIVKPPEEV